LVAALVLARTFASIPAVAQAHFSAAAVLVSNRFAVGDESFLTGG
jgi:hypothetical protein